MNRTLLGILLFSVVLLSASQLGAQAADQSHVRVFGGNFKGTAGEITEIKGDTLVLTTEQGSATVKTTEKTMYRREGAEAKLSDFKVGDRVIVGGEPGPNNTWTAAFVGVRRQGGPGEGPGGMMREAFAPDQMGKKFILGEVLKIDGTKLTVKRPDGVEQTIEVDEDTSFRKNRTESVTLADIKVGEHIAGRGEIKNGVFVPSVLNVGLPPMGPMRHNMQGQPAPPPPDRATQGAPTDAPKEDNK